MVGPRFVDVCAGAGGLALGLEQAGFEPVLLLDNKRVACDTLRLNRPTWEVLEDDLRVYVPSSTLRDVDLLSAGLPRVKSNAGGARSISDDELSLVKATVSLMHEIQPKALLLENVPNLATAREYEEIRTFVREELEHLGYRFMWFVLNAADFGVPQDRKQGVLVALAKLYFEAFCPPAPTVRQHQSVGAALGPSMASRGWPRAEQWAAQANRVAPTLVGGSERRGGADLGPTGSRRAWAGIGVDGSVLADMLPGPDFIWAPEQGRGGMVRITVDQAALLQGFPPEWKFAGKKTARYRQVGHASPPPVGKALGLAIQAALDEPKSVVAG
ncbi:DNA cytosine methyltransferase [Nocardia fusca]|uniref:DNA cytosine methyltransferase n=1 Tax=Nocardia fusca TaxID=941183 RepID=UPI0009FF08FE|nr:DNA cytosine methyltransferase [Nocardia fusca]